MADLEEERRKLRLEMKFRAKYHGAAALELGLSPEQLLLVEQYVEGLRTGRSSEGNLVAQLQKRVRGRDCCRHCRWAAACHGLARAVVAWCGWRCSAQTAAQQGACC